MKYRFIESSYTELSFPSSFISESKARYYTYAITDTYNKFCKFCGNDPMHNREYGYMNDQHKIVSLGVTLDKSTDDDFWFRPINREHFITMSLNEFKRAPVYNCIDFTNNFKEFCDRIHPELNCKIMVYSFYTDYHPDHIRRVRVHLAPVIPIIPGRYCNYRKLLNPDGTFDLNYFLSKCKTVDEYAKKFATKKEINASKTSIAISDDRFKSGMSYEEILGYIDPNILRRWNSNLGTYGK